MGLFRSLPPDADRAVLLVTDLHAGNVLAARPEPWLVIDPKPYVGDPAYDPTQHLLNCAERLHADPAGLAARMAHLLEVDPVRLRRWLFARCVLESPGDPALADVARRLPLDSPRRGRRGPTIRGPARLLAPWSAAATMTGVFALPAVFAVAPGLARCGCCGGVYPRRRVRRLAATPGVSICHDCARSSARLTATRRR
jgi:Aminoglycoside/hydroxyurea antibiotic resistance kinase